jgi:cysteine desulfurase/selenocysteine lyase
MTRRELNRLAWTSVFAAGNWSGSGRADVGSPRGLDVERCLADFPALAQHVNGHPLTYLDNAATTQRPAAVVNALADFYMHDNANPGAAMHALARRAHDRYENARSTLATFVNATRVDEIVWIRGTTEGINLVANTWARSTLRRGDELLVTLAEHASNLLPWRLIADQTGARLRCVDVDDEGRVRLDDLDQKLSERTRLVAFSHVSNVVGYINPAAEICARAHRAGARVLIDAAQSAPHVPIDVQALGCDFLTFSSHKMLGPMGVGVLWCRREILDEMPPYQAGSNMAHEIELDSYRLEHAARKFGAGTPNVAGPIGLAAAVRYLSALGREAIEHHERALTSYALDRLREVRGLRMLGPPESANRLPVFSFSLQDFSPHEVLQHLDARGIAIRAGDLSALPLLRRLGVSIAARASFYLYTRRSEIDRLVSTLQQLATTRS